MFAIQEITSVVVVETLLSLGARVSDRAEFGVTPLMLAAGRNVNPYVTLTLLENGAGINDRSAEGLTPLMFAAAFNPNPEIVDVLIDCEAKITLADKDGNTALDYAKKNPELYETETYWRLNNLSYE